MIASNFPDARRYGRRLKKRVENLYAEWFGPWIQIGYGNPAHMSEKRV